MIKRGSGLNLTVTYADPEFKTNIMSVVNGQFGGTTSAASTSWYNGMFQNSNITSFDSELPQLTNGTNMFYNCQLDTESIQRIASSLPSYTDGNSHYMYITSGASTVKEEEITAHNTIINKGWTSSGALRFTNVTGSVTIDMSSVTNGYGMFQYCTGLTSFSSGLSSLTNGGGMFSGCTGLTSFTSDLSGLNNGDNMFNDCSNLTSFDAELSSITTGNNMFSGTSLSESSLQKIATSIPTYTSGEHYLTIIVKDTYVQQKYIDFHTAVTNKGWKSGVLFPFVTGAVTNDFSSMKTQNTMFCNGPLTSFSGKLTNLEDGYQMFSNCNNLTTFSSDISKVTNGSGMFEYCSNLTSFSGDLSSLTSGYQMFYNCCLNLASLTNIADTINTVTSGNIHIGIGRTPTTDDVTQINRITAKGWTVVVGSTTYSPS